MGYLNGSHVFFSLYKKHYDWNMFECGDITEDVVWFSVSRSYCHYHIIHATTGLTIVEICGFLFAENGIHGFWSAAMHPHQTSKTHDYIFEIESGI